MLDGLSPESGAGGTDEARKRGRGTARLDWTAEHGLMPPACSETAEHGLMPPTWATFLVFFFNLVGLRRTAPLGERVENGRITTLTAPLVEIPPERLDKPVRPALLWNESPLCILGEQPYKVLVR